MTFFSNQCFAKDSSSNVGSTSEMPDTSSSEISKSKDALWHICDVPGNVAVLISTACSSFSCFYVEIQTQQFLWPPHSSLLYRDTSGGEYKVQIGVIASAAHHNHFIAGTFSLKDHRGRNFTENSVKKVSRVLICRYILLCRENRILCFWMAPSKCVLRLDMLPFQQNSGEHTAVLC